jgi:hypothetical protein
MSGQVSSSLAPGEEAPRACVARGPTSIADLHAIAEETGKSQQPYDDKDAEGSVLHQGKQELSSSNIEDYGNEISSRVEAGIDSLLVDKSIARDQGGQLGNAYFKEGMTFDEVKIDE